MSDHHQDRTNQILVQQHAELMKFLRQHVGNGGCLTPEDQTALDGVRASTKAVLAQVNAVDVTAPAQ